MAGYKRVFYRGRVSQVYMGRGSPVYDKMHLKIVEQFQKNVPQHKMSKTLKIPPSTVHDIMKRQETCLSMRGEVKTGSFGHHLVLQTGMFLYWTSLHGLRYISRNHHL